MTEFHHGVKSESELSFNLNYLFRVFFFFLKEHSRFYFMLQNVVTFMEQRFVFEIIPQQLSQKFRHREEVVRHK